MLQFLVFGALKDDEFYDREMFFQDGFDLFGLDKLIESLAPASPRGIEDDKDIFLFFRGLGLGFS
jgi:hypothetical protein